MNDLRIIDNDEFFNNHREHVQTTDAHNNTGRMNDEIRVTTIYTATGRGMGQQTWISEFSFKGEPNSGCYGEWFGHGSELTCIEYSGRKWIIIQDDDRYRDLSYRIYVVGEHEPTFEDVRQATCALESFTFEKKKAA